MFPLLVVVVWSVSGYGLQAQDVPPPPIGAVAVSRPFFNPTLGQSIAVTFRLGEPGFLELLILDRDGFPIRSLATEKAAQPGNRTFVWDGRDDAGLVVPDEAYSLKIELTARTGVHRYFPAGVAPKEVKATPGYYDRSTATFSYRLEAPARVHLQAGTSRTNPVTGGKSGPVLKTVVNREPRPGGAVVETWNGLDETHSYSVAELPDFVLAIAATSLPENALITIGNASETFLDRAARRSGTPLLLDLAGADHHHHRGLSALDDVSPSLTVSPSNATQSPKDHLWHPSQSSLKGSLHLAGAGAANFAKQPAKLMIFVDCERVETGEFPASGMEFEVPLESFAPGEHVVAFNWASDYGPVAATSLRIQRSQSAMPKSSTGGGR